MSSDPLAGRPDTASSDCPSGGRLSVRADLLIVLAAVAIGGVVGLWLDAFDHFAAWLSAHEEWELDEFVLPFFISPFAVAWFAYRRWQEAIVEAANRGRAELGLRRLTESLEEQVRLRTAQAEQRAEALARSNRELEQFAHVASHDLQEPLRKIVAFGDRLAAREQSLDEKGREYLTRMRGATTRMQALVDSLLSLSRVATKTGEFAPVELRPLALAVVADLDLRIREQGGRVRVGALPRIEADAVQIRQLLQNLLANALKFRRPSVAPEVSISAEGIESPGEGGPRYRIAVADNGIGFDDKYADRVFKPFQRLHGHAEYEGTGMGLAICSKIVERHGGSIAVKSADGAGATFTITLPERQPREDRP